MNFRKHLRLKEFDYSSANYYFVTLCTDYRKKLFVPRVSEEYGKLLSSDVVAGPWPAWKLRLTGMIELKLQLLEQKFPAEVDFYCIMEDHIHLIISLQARQRRATTLSNIINAFKGWCTREYGKRLFQPNYYEHIIRNEKSLSKIREYILDNPMVEYNKIPWSVLDLRTI